MGIWLRAPLQSRVMHIRLCALTCGGDAVGRGTVIRLAPLAVVDGLKPHAGPLNM